MNKKATDKVLSVYWFAILFIIAAAIVYMAVIFYGAPYDIRELEANSLTAKLADCISEGGYFKSNFFDSKGNLILTNENILEKCKINSYAEDTFGWKDDQYFIRLSFYDFKTKNKLPFEISNGNFNLNENCDRPSAILPVCVKRSLYVLDKNKQSYIVEILSIVRKTEKNAIQ